MFNNIYNGRTVLITGHSGFKGSWLTQWLEQMGAHVTGFSLDFPTTPNHYSLLELKSNSSWGDIRNREMVSEVVKSVQPEIIFHLAAQPLVRHSYENPAETFDTNIMGTVNILEAARMTSSVKAVVVVTSDKCYENHEDGIPFIESDPMGGYDPYSASKGACELIVSSYRDSFFNPEKYGISHSTLIASVRAGNVIGGGDWGKDRLVPDIMRAAADNMSVEIRSPNAIRPWQHVLEPLSGYLMVGQRLLESDQLCAGGWNFGPEASDHHTVREVCDMLGKQWQKVSFEIAADADLHEAETLRLDCSKAARILGWKPVWSGEEVLAKTAEWYRMFYETGKVSTEHQLNCYIEDAVKRDIAWSVV